MSKKKIPVVEIEDRFAGILLYYETDLIEFALSLFALVWGLWLLLPFRVFTFPIYQPLARFAPEEAWGMGMFVLGAIQMAAWLRGKHGLRRWLSFAGFFVWIVIFLMFLFGQASAVAVPVYGVIALMSALSFLHNGNTRR